MRKLLFFLFSLILIFCSKISIYAEEVISQKIPILLYHHIVPDSEGDFWKGNSAVITVSEFSAQMDYLHTNGFHTVSTKELQDFLYRGKRLPQQSVMIHFDDGYYSNIEFAYPILREYGFKAQVFLITETTKGGQKPYTKNALTFISEQSLESTRDIFEYASHSHDMHRDYENGKKTIMASSSKEDIIKDLQKSLSIVHNKKIFAYPKGQYNETIINALTKLEFLMAGTVEPGYVVQNSSFGFKLPRFIIPKDMSMQNFIKIVEGNYYNN